MRTACWASSPCSSGGLVTAIWQTSSWHWEGRAVVPFPLLAMYICSIWCWETYMRHSPVIQASGRQVQGGCGWITTRCCAILNIKYTIVITLQDGVGGTSPGAIQSWFLLRMAVTCYIWGTRTSGCPWFVRRRSSPETGD